MNKWWFKAPIILFCVLMVVTAVFIGVTANAASGMPEFPLIIRNNLDALIEFFRNNTEMLLEIW